MNTKAKELLTEGKGYNKELIKNNPFLFPFNPNTKSKGRKVKYSERITTLLYSRNVLPF